MNLNKLFKFKEKTPMARFIDNKGFEKIIPIQVPPPRCYLFAVTNRTPIKFIVSNDSVETAPIPFSRVEFELVGHGKEYFEYREATK